MTLQLIGTVLLVVGVLASVTFVAAYSYYTDWWRSEVGWHLVTFPAALGLLEASGLVFRLVGDYPGRQAVNAVLFAVIVATTVWRAVLVFRNNRPARPRRGAANRRGAR
jgi:hypothetical protein